ncbi:synaptojanin-1-like isoform X2 [Ornithodoros turicata]|uniref:synaptojanin-1-like isoform X2 n=1 Tax=Ornithodoros turicata TaxID=34597 RepID=UPI0031391A43
MPLGKSFRVYHKIRPPNPYSVLLEQRSKNETLLFESRAVAVLSQHETDTVKKEYTTLADAHGSLGVLQLTFGDTVVQFLVLVTGCQSVGKLGSSEIFRITDTLFVSLRNSGQDLERVQDVRKILGAGTFFFVWSSNQNVPLLDLTLCAQRAAVTNETDNRFFWNRTLHIPLLRYGIDCSRWLLKAMCGGVEMRTLYLGHQQAKVCLISRLSCERAGTRFNVRGTNDDGHVANFVETEQVIYLEDQITSYVQTRGSVPLFWEQPGVQVGSHRVKMSRGSEASAPAFERHMSQIKQRYGDQVIINLLGSKEGESMLTQMFQHHHKASRRKIPMVSFDYHSMCRGGRQDNLIHLKNQISPHLSSFGCFYFNGSEICLQQTGTFRTNCLDCLDRTNCVQTFIALEVLPSQVALLGLQDKPQLASRFMEVFRQMWVQNGDQVSKIYAGTGALEGKSKLKDGSRSMVRTIQNNLLDGSKQEAIDVLLLGSALSSELADRARALLPTGMLHLPPSILRSMCTRHLEYTIPLKARVTVATWNVNGGKHFNSVVFRNHPMSDWLVDNSVVAGKKLVDFSQAVDRTPADIYVIGFQEIVDLNASNIVNASTSNQKEWLTELQKTISRDHRYTLLTSAQLVGVCLFVFIRPEHAPHIRDVAVDMVKTGLGGAAGNKGGIAIRCLFHSTSLCFVCAHFAAGQSKAADRNADYVEITRRVSFPMGRTLNSHDYVFWCGDFNYRVDLGIDEVKELIRQQNWPELLKYDQLSVQQQQGQVFKDFIEGEISFPPTYKYDLFSDDYDTSEKCRVPAWTDRILFRRRRLQSEAEDPFWSPGRIAHYGRAELKTSDHRPVVADIDIEVAKVDESVREQIFAEVIEQMGPPDGTVIVRTETEDEVFDDDFINELVEIFSSVGEVVLIRFAAETLWVTFSEGQGALAAVHLSGKPVNGHKVTIMLKTPDWTQAVEHELRLCSNNTIPLASTVENGDDVAQELDFTPSEGWSSEFDYPGDDSNSSSGRSSPSFAGEGDGPAPPIPGRSTPTSVPPGRPPPPRPPPPSRPPPPTRPPPADVIKPIEQEETSCTAAPMPKRVPPPRPVPPPIRPPPPSTAAVATEVGLPPDTPPPPPPPPRVDSFDSNQQSPENGDAPSSPWQTLPPAPPPPVEATAPTFSESPPAPAKAPPSPPCLPHVPPAPNTRVPPQVPPAPDSCMGAPPPQVESQVAPPPCEAPPPPPVLTEPPPIPSRPKVMGPVVMTAPLPTGKPPPIPARSKAGPPMPYRPN